MGFAYREDDWADLPIEEFRPGRVFDNPAEVMPHLAISHGVAQNVVDLFTELLRQPDSDQFRGLSFGMWDDRMPNGSTPARLIEALIAAAPQLPNLRALFLGHITQDEFEVSWISLCDVSPLWEAFPELTHLRIRGGSGLSLGRIEHAFLEELIIESGGLPRNVVQEIAAAKLPNLTHLELYTGDSGYGGDTRIDDLRPLLRPGLFPKLTWLAICNSELADDIAVALAEDPRILEQLAVLDLSQGTLSDRGGAALLNCPAIRSLQFLDLYRHYMSDEMIEQLAQLPIEIDMTDQVEPDDYGDDDMDGRYVAIGE